MLIQEVPARKYPTDALAAHLFGYVGEASESQVNEQVTRGLIVGKSGVELVYNSFLMGEDGERHVVVNSVGREVNMLGQQLPTEGHRLQLTIDYDLQKAAQDGFKAAGFNGAALIMDPRNGEVLSYVSLPGYDPNDFAAGIDSVKWASLNTDKLRPLANRVIQGRYSRVDLQDRRRHGGARGGTRHARLPGALLRRRDFYGRYYKCHLKGGHGTVDCAMRSRSRATSTSTRSATCSGSTSFTSGPTSSAWPGRPASICRASRKAWCPPPSGS